MSGYTTVIVKKATKSVSENSVRDPKIQAGWDEAKLGAAWMTTREFFKAILHNMKDGRGEFKYPKKTYTLSDSMEDLTCMIKDELDFRDKIHGQTWVSSTNVMMSREIAEGGNCWPEGIPYPNVKGKDVVFNLAGSVGSPDTRELINSRVFPELDLGDYLIRTFPVYEKWNEKKHSASEKGEWGYVERDGKRIQRKTKDYQDPSKNVCLWDISIVRKTEVASSDSD